MPAISAVLSRDRRGPPRRLLSGFVGAGLVFAAVTDTCGVAMALARMPWNQRAAVTCKVPESR